MNTTDISGIGDATAQQMRTHGLDSVEAVARASIEQLVAVPGIGAARAAALRESARRLLPDDAGTESPEAVPAAAGDGAAANGQDVKEKKKEKKERKKGKSKKQKKGKKDKKKGKKKAKGGKKKKNKGK